jgi:hypothetical protein
MVRRYGHIGQTAQRQAVNALNEAGFQGDGAQNSAQRLAIAHLVQELSSSPLTAPHGSDKMSEATTVITQYK